MAELPAASPDVRVDLKLIAGLIAPGSRVLDVGCGEGDLLALLERMRGVDARGLEISQDGVHAAVARGLSVIQGDADTDLSAYPDRAFDYVILSQTLQATRNPRDVLENLLRIGERCVVSFPNFGFWRMRLKLLFGGRMPKTGLLPDPWWGTKNIHFCTIRDFAALAEEIDAKIVLAYALDARGRKLSFKAPWWFWNLFGEQAIFVLEKRRSAQSSR